MTTDEFKEAYKKLNTAQKEAVDTIDGPVMVIAGPGTGKTQVLALRIANILIKTDTKADGILALTFTNSGVRAMRARLSGYIGHDADNVRIATFHSFAIELVEKHYELLDFPTMPKLLADDEAVSLVDEILHDNTWEYLRPRTNPTMYFGELRQLISILKRERLTPQEFLVHVAEDIKHLQNDPTSISTRGESKGKMKKEVEKKIESLLRTQEVVEFYRLYEEKKKENSLMDYDDVLSYAVELAENFEDVRADIKENFLYILVDEHQDSSGVQNSFLRAVWQDTEQPNIFVVGDDRQLIYGFSGATLDYFKEFAHMFGKAKLITLVENYRSTAPILKLADDLLGSTITKDKLQSNIKGEAKVALSEYHYPRDEILACGLYFKGEIASGIDPSECALLVPKNHHVRTAMQILKDMGVPVSSGKTLSLFSAPEAEALERVLSIITDPENPILLSESILDSSSGIPALAGHKFLKSLKASTLTIDAISTHGNAGNLFDGENPISKWGHKLAGWVEKFRGEMPSRIVSELGHELLIDQASTHEEILRRVEVVRSFIHLALQFEHKNNRAKLADFLPYLSRLQSYNSHIELATFGGASGVQVMTLHKSKGMEYNCVWVAHMNEEVLMSEKRSGFTLPEKVKVHINERDVAAAKRELYVAITRARQSCTLSYSRESYTGAEMELAHIIKELPDIHFIKKTAEATESELVANPKVYTAIEVAPVGNTREELIEFVQEHFAELKVSVTMLNNFFECPWKWYFRNFLKLPELKSVSLALGSAVHSTIEYILKNKTLPAEVDIKEKIKSELIKEGVHDPKDLARLFKDADRAVSDWIKNYYSTLAKDYISERSVQFRDPQFPDLLIYGKLDLTERFPDPEGKGTSDGAGARIVVTDFKTGKPKTKNEIEKIDDQGKLSSYMRQLAMYSYLVAGAEKGKVVSSLRLLFLEAPISDKNALYSTTVGDEEIDLLVRDIREYNQALLEGTWVNNTCLYKPWGATGEECPYCKLSKRVLGV